jgi:hypothetical protein
MNVNDEEHHFHEHLSLQAPELESRDNCARLARIKVRDSSAEGGALIMKRACFVRRAETLRETRSFFLSRTKTFETSQSAVG